MISVFAPQGMNDATMIVIFLSFSFSIVLVAIIPGTEQPVPIKIGIALVVFVGMLYMIFRKDKYKNNQSKRAVE